MTPFEAFQTYIALKQHFTSNYDYFKYHGKVSATENAFHRRKDSLFFGKIALHNDPFGFLLCQVSNDPKVYIRDIAYKKHAQERYERWHEEFTNPLISYEKELKALAPRWKQVKKGQHPFALKAYLSGELSLQSFCIFLSLNDQLDKYNEVLKDDIVWKDVGFMVRKYLPFMKYDKTKAKQITREVFCGIGYS